MRTIRHDLLILENAPKDILSRIQKIYNDTMAVSGKPPAAILLEYDEYLEYLAWCKRMLKSGEYLEAVMSFHDVKIYVAPGPGGAI